MVKGVFQQKKRMTREGNFKDQNWRNDNEIVENVVKYNILLVES